jgi:HAD superfamily hydrolase (TIGR01490 family)
LWVRRELALGYVSKRQALRAAMWLARYQLGFASAEVMLEEAVAEITGTREVDLRERTGRFYEQEVRSRYRPGGLEAVKAHRAASDRCVLLTSSSNYMSEHVQRQLKLDGVLCNTFEVDAKGRHTGKLVGRTCFASGKLAYAEAEAKAHGVALCDCTFYTDSYSDLSVLEVVGRPVPVNPDPRLRRLAAKKGWRVAQWGVPHGP